MSVRERQYDREDDHDARVRDEDRFAGRSSHLGYFVRPGCSAKECGRKTWPTAAHGRLAVIWTALASPRFAAKICPELMARPRFAARLNNFQTGLDFFWGDQKRDHTVDRTVARMNVEHYRRLLAVETDEARRQVLLRLLAEEEAKLADPKTPGRSK